MTVLDKSLIEIYFQYEDQFKPKLIHRKRVLQRLFNRILTGFLSGSNDKACRFILHTTCNLFPIPL